MIITGLTGTSSGSSEEILEKMDTMVEELQNLGELMSGNIKSLMIDATDYDNTALLKDNISIAETAFSATTTEVLKYTDIVSFKSYADGTANINLENAEFYYKNNDGGYSNYCIARLGIFIVDSNSTVLASAYSEGFHPNTTYHSATIPSLNFNFSIENGETYKIRIALCGRVSLSGMTFTFTEKLTSGKINFNYAIKNLVADGPFSITA